MQKPVPYASDAGNSADMTRVRERLDQLGALIGQMASVQSAAKADQAQRMHLPAQIDPATQAAIASAAKMSAQANAQLELMQREMADMKAAFVQMARQPATPDLSNDLKRIADGVARLQEPTPDNVGHLDDIALELHQMRQAIHSIAEERGTPDSQSIMHSIEEGYALIAGRLESALVHRSQGQDDQTANRQISTLADHVTAMRDMVEQLPLRMPVEELNQRIGQIGDSIAELAGRGDQSILKNFRHIENRLDEVTRALVAVSVTPGGGFENDALDRIEARLSTLAKSIESMPLAGIQPQADTSHYSVNDDINRQLAEIASSIENFQPTISHQDPWGPTILDRIDEISRHLAATPVAHAIPVVADDQTKKIVGELTQLSQRVDALRTETANSGDDLSNVILGELSELSARMDALRAFQVERPGASNLSLKTVEDQIAILVDRIDQMAGATAAQPFADDRLSALEQTLSQIAQRLNTVSGNGVDFSPLAERLDSIEQQFSVSREMAMEAAEQAAERAFQMAGQMPLTGTGNDPLLLENLAREVQALEVQARDIADRNFDGFDTIRQMLETIGQRIEGIEADIRDATSEARANESQSGNGMPERENQHYSNDDRHPAFRDAPLSGSDAIPDGAQWAAQNRESGDFSRMDNRHPQDDQFDHASRQVLPELEVEDVPLEPGSGIPDLAALVRDASQRRKAATSTDSPEKSGSPHDFLAAARRAAQASAVENVAAPGAENIRDQFKPKKPSGISAFISQKRKLLMGAAAAVLLLAVAVPLASRFLASEPKVVDVETQVEQQSGNTAPAQVAAEPQIAADNTPSVKPVEELAPQNAGTPALAGEQTIAPATMESQSAATDNALADIPPVPQEAGNPALREAAAAGDPSALFEIARRFTDGEGVKRDLATAAVWYEASARSGSAPAQYRFANFLEKGHGVPLDVEKSAVWYQRAAEQGNALAMHNLAVIHTSGLIGGKPDMESALGWFEKAAELGVKDSQVNLGIIYAKGLGVEADLVAAYKWLSVAARGGDSDAASKRDTLASAMRPDQLEKARAEAEIWKPGNLDPIANVAVVLPEWKDGAGESASTVLPGNKTQGANAASGEVTREMIAKVQSLLAGMGYDPGPADGQIGARTRDAVKAFQTKIGMPANGEISAELVEKLAANAA